jgi:flavorubredoxin
VETQIDEIAPDVFRLSTLVPDVAPGGFSFNQFLVRDEQPFLFHTGMRQLYPLVSAAVSELVPLDQLRWISFAHVEADECGAMNEWLAVASEAEVAHGAIGCMVSLNDLADRAPRPLADGEVLDLGDKRVRHLDTPHVPHGWDARVLFEETTGTLLCGDLFTHLGDVAPLTSDDIVEPAAKAEAAFHSTALTHETGSTIRTLAELSPTTLALMHGSSFNGDCAAALTDLAAHYDTLVTDRAN